MVKSLMDFQELADGIVRANFHRGGIKLLKILALKPGAFSPLRDEVLEIAAKDRFTRDGAPGHASNWTNPVGDVRQFSLLNKSGNTADPSSDHELSTLEKRFHRSAAYPHLAALMSVFPDSINFRIRVLGKQARLPPHEEHVVHWDPGARKYFLRPRFHLPIKTNPRSETSLDGDVHHLEEGAVYYYNNGTVHSAVNDGDEERVHLVWDSLLTSRTHDRIFGGGGTWPAGYEPLSGAAARPRPLRTEPVGDFTPYGPAVDWHRNLRLGRLGVRASSFSRLYGWFDSLVPRRVEPAVPR